MSLCVDGSGRYCQCQPDDGQPCIEIERLRARVAALEAENAELRKDAERGRWLVANLTRLCIDTNRTINRDVWVKSITINGALLLPNEDSVRAAIDAAREGGK